MSTRSNIRVMCEDGKVREIYCHFDGDSHLETLLAHYNTQRLAEELLNLGDLSSLDDCASIPPEGHDFDHPVKGYCVAYHRDRGESWDQVQPKKFSSFSEAWEHQDNVMIEYIYEWDTLTWHQYKNGQGTRSECFVA